MTQRIFSIKFSAQSKHNLLIFPLIFTILQFNFPIFIWPYGHFNLGTFFYHHFFLFPELSWATTVTALTPVSYYYTTSFNYGGYKDRDVGLTCRYHLSNIMSDISSIIVQDGRVSNFFSLGVAIAVFLSIEEMDSVLSP